MKITISGRHVDVTDGLKAHAVERFDRLEKYFGNISGARITMSVDGPRQVVEAVLHAGRATLIAEVDAADMYAAIDLAATKLERQLRKHKDRMRRRRGGTHPRLNGYR